MMSDRLWQRLGAAGGLLYVVLGLTGNTIFFVANIEPNAAREDVAAYWTAVQATAGPRVWTMLLAFFCLTFFLGRLYSLLRRAEGEHGYLATVAFAGGLFTVLVQIIEFTRQYAALQLVGEGLDPTIARALLHMNSGSFILSWFTLAILMSATAIVVIRTGALPRWLGWIAAVLAVGLLVTLAAAAGSFFEFPLPFVISLLWIATTSVIMVVRGDQLRPAVRADQVASPVAS